MNKSLARHQHHQRPPDRSSSLAGASVGFTILTLNSGLAVEPARFRFDIIQNSLVMPVGLVGEKERVGFGGVMVAWVSC